MKKTLLLLMLKKTIKYLITFSIVYCYKNNLQLCVDILILLFLILCCNFKVFFDLSKIYYLKQKDLFLVYSSGLGLGGVDKGKGKEINNENTSVDDDFITSLNEDKKTSGSKGKGKEIEDKNRGLNPDEKQSAFSDDKLEGFYTSEDEDMEIQRAIEMSLADKSQGFSYLPISDSSPEVGTSTSFPRTQIQNDNFLDNYFQQYSEELDNLKEFGESSNSNLKSQNDNFLDNYIQQYSEELANLKEGGESSNSNLENIINEDPAILSTVISDNTEIGLSSNVVVEPELQVDVMNERSSNLDIQPELQSDLTNEARSNVEVQPVLPPDDYEGLPNVEVQPVLQPDNNKIENLNQIVGYENRDPNMMRNAVQLENDRLLPANLGLNTEYESTPFVETFPNFREFWNQFMNNDHSNILNITGEPLTHLGDDHAIQNFLQTRDSQNNQNNIVNFEDNGTVNSQNIPRTNNVRPITDEIVQSINTNTNTITDADGRRISREEFLNNQNSNLISIGGRTYIALDILFTSGARLGILIIDNGEFLCFAGTAMGMYLLISRISYRHLEVISSNTFSANDSPEVRRINIIFQRYFQRRADRIILFAAGGALGVTFLLHE